MPKFARGYLKKLLHGQHDSDRVYIEKMQATIPSIEIRKKLAILERYYCGEKYALMIE